MSKTCLSARASAKAELRPSPASAHARRNREEKRAVYPQGYTHPRGKGGAYKLEMAPPLGNDKVTTVPSIDTLRRPTANPLRSPRSWKVCGERSDLQRHSSFCRAAGARSKSGAEG
ncbi:unnamed protein product [Rangifer tarandus platyrhynchus]|uniref:Uncharacterized protein n=1 Tax=Rangifer tarandus platyrhynchus TaxID=3082113 RepID=A0AC59YZT8_RANTA